MKKDFYWWANGKFNYEMTSFKSDFIFPLQLHKKKHLVALKNPHYQWSHCKRLFTQFCSKTRMKVLQNASFSNTWCTQINADVWSCNGLIITYSTWEAHNSVHVISQFLLGEESQGNPAADRQIVTAILYTESYSSAVPDLHIHNVQPPSGSADLNSPSPLPPSQTPRDPSLPLTIAYCNGITQLGALHVYVFIISLLVSWQGSSTWGVENNGSRETAGFQEKQWYVPISNPRSWVLGFYCLSCMPNPHMSMLCLLLDCCLGLWNNDGECAKIKSSCCLL